MLKIKKLTLSGIGRFVEEQTIDFTATGGLIQVDGQNNNTGGSSGSGKSTIFNAIDFLFGLNDIPNTILQSRLSKEPINVSGEFDFNGQELKLTRAKGKLSVTLGTEVTIGSNKLAEERLDAIIGMPRGLFRQMLHKRQKEGGFFLQLSPKETHEFLTDCLGLSSIREKTESLDEKIKALLRDEIDATNSLHSANTGLLASQNALKVLVAPKAPVDKETIIKLKNESDIAIGKLKALETEHVMKMNLLHTSRPSVEVVSFDRQALEAHQVIKEGIERQISELLQVAKDEFAKKQEQIRNKKLEQNTLRLKIQNSEKAQEECKRIAEDIKKIRNCQCPTCMQTVSSESSKEQEAGCTAEIVARIPIIKEGNAAKELLFNLDLEIGGLSLNAEPLESSQIPFLNGELARISSLILAEKQKESRHILDQNNKNSAAMTAFANQQRALKNELDIEIDSVRGYADITRRTLDLAVSQLRAYEDNRVRYETSQKTLQIQCDAYDMQSRNAAELIALFTSQLEVAEELKRAFKSFISRSFDDALAAIGDSATNIVRSIPNMQTATIQLEGTKETKEGKVKEEVNALIHVDGEEAIPIKSLSGGERSSVDLAIDLAVIDFMENKANKGIDIYVLDEAFTGLDAVSVEMVLELLKNAQTNKKIIVIDHNEVVKQMVENRIVVVRDGLTSRIVQ